MGSTRVGAKAVSTEGSLKQLIRTHLGETREVLPLVQNGQLRASGLSGLCPREEVLASQLKLIRKDEVSAELGLIFAHGKGLHWVLQNEVLAHTRALVGIWTCLGCAKTFGALEPNLAEKHSFVPQPSACDVCKSTEFVYREQHFHNDEYRVGGHPDGFLVLPGMPGIGIVECKSIGSHRVWEVKHTPDMGHVVQTQAYMWLTGLKWAKILYWEKGGSGINALIEHAVERDEEAIEAIKSMLQSIWKGLETGELPERICAVSDCPRAKKCSVVQQCFEGT